MTESRSFASLRMTESRSFASLRMTRLHMPEHVPAEVLGRGLVHRVGHMAESAGDVMLEATLADVAQQRLQIVDLDDTGAAEGLERIFRELPLADVPANAS